MKRAICLVIGLSLLPFTSATRAQEPDPRPWVWRNLSPVEGASPEPRSAGTAIYDPVSRRVVVFGGQTDGGHLNDVWAFDLLANQWTRLETTGEPPEPRLGANALYDPNGHQMVIWAGQQGNRFYNDTWALDLQSLAWRDVSPRPSDRPQARYGSGAVFDPAERRLVQFAGFTDISRRFNDTQAFDLDTLSWEEVGRTGERPEIRCLLTAALDSPSRRMIVYGGQRNGPLDDIWAFDLATRQWTNLTPGARPAGRMLATSFIDRDGRFIVFGGATGSGRVNETWMFDLATLGWTELETFGPPSARDSAMGAYVEDEDRFIVIGGIANGRTNEVWELRRTSATTLVR